MFCWLNDTGTEVMEHFLNQEVAFEIQGIWGLTDVQKNGSAFDVGVMPLKQIGICSEIGPMMLAIPQNMRDDAKQQAQEFIRYMISIDAQQAILIGEYSPEHDAYYPFRTPLRKDMANTPLMQMNPIYQVFIEGFDNPSVDVPVPAWQNEYRLRICFQQRLNRRHILIAADQLDICLIRIALIICVYDLLNCLPASRVILPCNTEGKHRIFLWRRFLRALFCFRNLVARKQAD